MMFSRHGIGERIRAAAARRVLGTDHPFAVKRIHTDGRTIFLEAQKETGDAALYDLVRDIQGPA